MHLIVVANRQPAWVDSGFDEYAKRLRGSVKFKLRPIGLARRSSGIERARDAEGRRVLAALPSRAHVVALSEQGRQWSTRELAARLEDWLGRGLPVCLLIGGPDGLSEACLERSDETWGLSKLTLPHGLARIVVAEALYRAFSVLTRHPYHRA